LISGVYLGFSVATIFSKKIARLFWCAAQDKARFRDQNKKPPEMFIGEK